MFSPLIDVFGDQEVIRLFSEESLVAAWLEVERALADAQAELGVIPREVAQEIAAAAVLEDGDLAALREQTLLVGFPILPLPHQILPPFPAAGRSVARWRTGYGHRARAAKARRAARGRRPPRPPCRGCAVAHRARRRRRGRVHARLARGALRPHRA